MEFDDESVVYLTDIDVFETCESQVIMGEIQENHKMAQKFQNVIDLLIPSSEQYLGVLKYFQILGTQSDQSEFSDWLNVTDDYT